LKSPSDTPPSTEPASPALRRFTLRLYKPGRRRRGRQPEAVAQGEAQAQADVEGSGPAPKLKLYKSPDRPA
jgi:hypothetical protein